MVPLRRRPGRWVGAAILVTVAIGCGDGRPDERQWGTAWRSQRDSIPSAEAFVSAGRSGCDEMLGRLRVELEGLRETPSDEIDAEFEAWATRAESLAFECPDDPGDVRSRLAELNVLARSIDAALDAER